MFAHGEWLESCAQNRCKAYLFARSLLSIEKEKGTICDVQLISCPFHLSEQLLHSCGKYEEVFGRHFAAPSRTTGAEKCCRKKKQRWQQNYASKNKNVCWPPSVPILFRTSGFVKLTAKLDWLGPARVNPKSGKLPCALKWLEKTVILGGERAKNWADTFSHWTWPI